MQQEGGNAAPTRCPQFTDSLDGGTKHRVRVVEGESSPMDRSIMEEAHPCRFAPRRRSQRETRSVPTLPSAVFRRQIARTAVTCSLGHGLGWVGLHDRILWEVGFAKEWKVELLTYMCIG